MDDEKEKKITEKQYQSLLKGIKEKDDQIAELKEKHQKEMLSFIEINKALTENQKLLQENNKIQLKSAEEKTEIKIKDIHNAAVILKKNMETAQENNLNGIMLIEVLMTSIENGTKTARKVVDLYKKLLTTEE